MGGGYWVFAQDATFYFPQAVAVAEKGLRAIVFYDRGSASVSYVQLLACMIALIGRPTSVGILLNLFCYLGTMALLVRWGRAQSRTRTSVPGRTFRRRWWRCSRSGDRVPHSARCHRRCLPRSSRRGADSIRLRPAR